MSEEIFDYIIAGAGSAGCVIANCLSALPDTSVLLLEAGGPDRNIWFRIPLGIGRIVGDRRYTWNARTEPEPGLHGNRIGWESGKVLGGSSSVNGMLAVRGHPQKYDEWEAAGCPGWGFKDVLPYFKRLENCEFGDSEFRGKSGPISVSEANVDVLGHAFLESCGSAGYSRTSDYNGRQPEGAGPFQLCVRNGVRSSTSSAYLRPALRRNSLKTITHAVVQEVVFRERRAIGVRYSLGNDTLFARARREVIVCSGGIRSPQLLELSGIGQGQILEKHGIKVVQHLSEVGENLQDHLMVRVCFECTEPVTIYDLLQSPTRMTIELAKYLFFRKGMFSIPSFSALAFVCSEFGLPIPDLRIQLGLTSGKRRLSGEVRTGLDPFSGFHLGGYSIYPRSRGSLHIRSRNPNETPAIVANYLSDLIDRAKSVRVIKLLRQISAHPPLISLYGARSVLVRKSLMTAHYSNTCGITARPVGILAVPAKWEMTIWLLSIPDCACME